jgi:ABC-type transport system substrate-binding protein
VGVTASRMPTLRSARKIDDLTVELTTSEPDAFLPINLTNLFMASPAPGRRSTTPCPPA